MRRASLLLAAFLFAVSTHGWSQTDQTRGPKTGTWEVVGKDKREWKAVLVFTRSVRNSYDGYFKWQALSGAPASGHEAFQGTYNPANGMLVLKGLDMKDKQGSIAVGSTYEAIVTEGGTGLRNGTWFGPTVAPGTWSAVWKSADTPAP
jgi:hypothetical protein